MRNVLLVISILLNVLAAGFAGYYFIYEDKDEVEEVEVGAEVDEDVLGEKTPGVKGVEVEEPEELEVSVSEFEWDAVEEGDVVNGWTVTSAGPFSDMLPFSEENISVDFEGEATLTGRFFYQAPGEGMGGEMLCFGDMTSGSLDNYPWMVDAYTTASNAWFCFENQDFAMDEFGVNPGVSVNGNATVKISNLQLVYYPSEVSSMADLVEVISYDDGLGDYKSKNFTLSFDVPDGFEIQDSKNFILISEDPYVTTDMGSSNAFFTLSRYGSWGENDGRVSRMDRYRGTLNNLKESTVMVDGYSFTKFTGTDSGIFEGSSAGETVVVFFDASSLEIMERPMNTDQSFDPIDVGMQILNSFKFAK